MTQGFYSSDRIIVFLIEVYKAYIFQNVKIILFTFYFEREIERMIRKIEGKKEEYNLDMISQIEWLLK